MNRRLKSDSWQYLTRELDPRLKPVQALAAYLEENSVLFWQKDCKPLAKQARSGPSFTASSLPSTVRDECREAVADLLNGVLAYYEKVGARRQVQKRRIDVLRQQIPLHEQEQLDSLRETYGKYLNSSDRRLTRLETKQNIQKWMGMSSEEKSAWFYRVTSIADERKRRADELRRQLDEELERMRQERERRFKEQVRHPQTLSLIGAYQVLGVPITAGADEIRRVWRHLVKQHHPDRGGNSATFIEIQKAYELIEATV